jgi:8-oxo-dGTP pyrophosphatase MutT (NUDIX family)
MVQRKDSLMYVEFVRGKYRTDDKPYVMDILEGMTSDEQETLRTMTFIQLWQSVWGKSAPKKCLAVEFNTATKLYQQLTDGSLGYTLSDLLDEISKCIPEREWGFPKGRRNIRESDEMCALREFNEETGVHCMAIQRFFMNFEEVFVGSNGVSYKHKYFLARLMDPVAGNAGNATNETQAEEISCTRWLTFHEVMAKLTASESRQSVMRAANLETMKVMTCGGVYLT